MNYSQTPNCIAWSFCYATNIFPDTLYQFLKHDGWQPIKETLVHDGNLTQSCLGKPSSIHVQELVDVAYSLGFAMTPVDLHAYGSYSDACRDHFQVKFFDNDELRFSRYVLAGCGFIEGQTKQSGHAVAFEYGMIFDQRGFSYPFNFSQCQKHDFTPTTLWLIQKIKKN